MFSKRVTKKRIRQKDVSYKVYFKIAVIILLGLFLSRANIKELLFPFGQAYLAVMLIHGIFPQFALLGCVLGYLTMAPTIPFGSLFICVFTYFAVKIVEKKRKVERKRLTQIMFVAFSLLGVMIFNFRLNFFIVVSLMDIMLSYFMLVVFDKSVNVLYAHRKRSILSDEECICIIICLCVGVIVCANKAIFGFDTSIVLATMVTIIFGFLSGPGVGCAAGIIMGLSATMGGGSFYIIGNLGMSGLLCGSFKKFGRIGSILGFVIANALLTLYMNGSALTILPIKNTILAGILVFALPDAFLSYLGKFINNSIKREKQENYYLEKVKGITLARLDNVSYLFEQMSDMFKHVNNEKKENDVSCLVEKVANVSCANCINHKECWNQKFYKSYSVVNNLLLTIRENGDLETFVHDDMHFCLNPKMVVKNANDIYTEYSKNIIMDSKLNESRVVVGEQLKGVSYVIGSLAKEIDSDVGLEQDIEQYIRQDLDALGVITGDVIVVKRDEKLEVQIGIKGCNGDKECVKRIQQVVAKNCGKNMVKMESICNFAGNRQCKLVYEEAKTLVPKTFVVQSAKSDSLVCGDSYAHCRVDDNNYLICISDGMGSGEKASKESSSCVSLIQSFFKVGFLEDTIFKTINKLMILKNDDEIFTTVDLCVLDLIRGVAKFTKIGAVPSFVIGKNGSISCIAGESLPLGIIDVVEPYGVNKKIKQGDILIMMTDGIFDRFGGISNLGKIKELMLEIVGKNKDEKQIANNILDMAMNTEVNVEDDDMTISVTTFRNSFFGQ